MDALFSLRARDMDIHTEMRDTQPPRRGHATTDQLRRVHTERRPRAGEPGAPGTARCRRSEEEGCQRTETAAEASGTRPPAGIGDADAARAGASTGFENPKAPRRAGEATEAGEGRM